MYLDKIRNDTVINYGRILWKRTRYATCACINMHVIDLLLLWIYTWTLLRQKMQSHSSDKDDKENWISRRGSGQISDVGLCRTKISRLQSFSMKEQENIECTALLTTLSTMPIRRGMQCTRQDNLETWWRLTLSYIRIKYSVKYRPLN